MVERVGIVRHKPGVVRRWVEQQAPLCMVTRSNGRAMAFLVPGFYDWRPLQVHHLLSGALRSDEPCNLLLVAALVHDAAHGHHIRVNHALLPKLTLPMLLWCKRERDPQHWFPARLAQLLGRPLPEPELPPDVYRTLWTTTS